MQNCGVVAIMVYRMHTRNHFALAFVKDSAPVHTRQDAGTPTIPDKTQYKVIAGRPRMANYFAAECTLYCFLIGLAWGGDGIGPGPRAAGNMRAPPPSLSKNNTKRSQGARAWSNMLPQGALCIVF